MLYVEYIPSIEIWVKLVCLLNKVFLGANDTFSIIPITKLSIIFVISSRIYILFERIKFWALDTIYWKIPTRPDLRQTPGFI